MGSLYLVLVILQLSWSLSSSVAPPSSHLCLPHQRDVLLHFKTTISVHCFQDPYPTIDVESWNKSIDCCSWEGVECDNVNGHVIGIDLSHSCLDGSLFANNSLFQLHNLQWLDLSSNYLRGSLLENTSCLFHFHGLQRLNLSDNDFNGTISSKLFSQLVSLTHLDLSYNDFSFNSFESRFDGQGFDMLARNLTKLRNLVLDSVDMSDVALTSFLNLSSSLEHLSLSLCELHGELPTQVFQLPNLKVLDLSVNANLTGYLPNTNWSSGLELLDLCNCGFRGSIPASFGNLTQIISVDLSINSLEGQIPDVFGNLRKLTYLRFSSCNLSGPLPVTIFNLTRITRLDLSNNHLEGPFPNHVSELQFLEVLELYKNSISGGVPSWLFALPSLPLLDLRYNKLVGPIDQIQKLSSIQIVDLSNNNIGGSIPYSIFDLVNLTSLDLSSNNLSGVIKSDMLSKLTSLMFLDVSNNSLLSLSTSGNDVNYSFPQLRTVDFSGCSVSQFPDFFRTSNLETLDLSNNMISGGISKWEAEGWEGLRLLDLSHNFLTALEQFPGNNLVYLNLHSNLLQGPILPTCLNPQIPILKHLLLNDNQLEGLVPSSLANSTSLELLNLGNKLTDRFPRWLASLSSLKVLILRFNRFYRSLPHFVASSNFSALRIIDLSANEFIGTLSTKLLRNLRAMKDKPREHDLKSLRLRDVGQLIYLQMLNFSHNNFTGPIPTSLGNLVALESLDLSSNKFSGRIPPQMTNLTFLEVLNLSNNNLVGPIPHGNQFHTFDNDSYSGNLGLCGLPLSKQCVNFQGPDPPSPLVVEHGGSKIPFFWQVVMMGYGSGVVMGLSLGYIVFTIGRLWWFVRKVERDWQYNFTKWVQRNKVRRN
ncbi:hypothetical protein ES332_D08G028600v1 [Gossypium tomentosum]|uniref:Leucine-rich repeat-containing N-terminal plant-type domain-containing protein n=1 Tax=Gossypium tomentosum TaxID=34277 RepID=A0A5D2JQ92_GOSTO|nr:hypothetical protein ES332_D08G028600v1 [Gossypium tomentosum]